MLMPKAISNTFTLSLQVWGTLKVLLEAKSQGLIEKIEPYITNLSEAGMWVSAEVKQRILILAGES